MENTPTLTNTRIDAVLAFLPAFEQPDLSAGRWRVSAGALPYWESNPQVMAFVQTLYATEFIFSFDWGAWSAEAQRYTDGGAAALADADLLTLRKLLTSYVRADRFSAGTLAAMFSNGQIVAILRRLKQIREQLE
jgi:hypothetical protein